MSVQSLSDKEVLAKVRELELEDPSDREVRDLLLRRPEELLPSAFKWFRSLIHRNGVKFDFTNPNHITP